MGMTHTEDMFGIQVSYDEWINSFTQVVLELSRLP